jgi:hypothetical protein
LEPFSSITDSSRTTATRLKSLSKDAAAASASTITPRVVQSATSAAAAAATARPSKAVMIAWVLAVLLVRSWWKDVPPWIQQLVWLPWKIFVVVPVKRMLYQIRRRLLRIPDGYGNSTSMNTTTNTTTWEEVGNDSDGGITVLQKIQNVLDLAQSATDSVTLGEMLQLHGALIVLLRMVNDDEDVDDDIDRNKHNNTDTIRKNSTQFEMAKLWADFYQSSGEPLFVDDDNNDDDDDLVVVEVSTLRDPTSKKAVSNRTTMLTTWIDQLQLADWAYLVETDEIRTKLQELSSSSSSKPTTTTNTTSGASRNGRPAMEWHLVRHVSTNEPGRVGHYIAVDSQSKTALIAVKGTSALSDLITDACGVPVRYNITSTTITVAPPTRTIGKGNGNNITFAPITNTTASSTTTFGDSSIEPPGLGTGRIRIRIRPLLLLPLL